MQDEMGTSGEQQDELFFKTIRHIELNGQLYSEDLIFAVKQWGHDPEKLAILKKIHFKIQDRFRLALKDIMPAPMTLLSFDKLRRPRG